MMANRAPGRPRSTPPASPDAPVERVIRAFGGLHATSRALNRELRSAGRDPVHFTAISKWRSRGGNIPQRWHRWILRAAARGRVLRPTGDGMYRILDHDGVELTAEPLPRQQAERLLEPRLTLDDLLYVEPERH